MGKNQGKRRKGRKGKSQRPKPRRTKETVIKIPKNFKRGHPQGFSKLTRVQSKKQAVYGYAITYSPSYKKGHGTIVNVQGMGRMPEYRAERLFLQRAYDITPQQTEPQRL